MNKRIIITAVIGVSFLAFLVLKLKSNKQHAEEKIYIHDVDAPVLVETVKPQMHRFENEFSYLGIFEPGKQNTIGADISGKVIRISFSEGDVVQQGEVLAKLDDELLRLQLENAEVNVEGQKNDDARYSTLSKENAVSGVQVEKSKLGLRSAEIQKKQIQKQIKSTTITAPFSGVITKKMIDLGSFIGPGTSIAEITDISTLKLTVNVPERDILKFKNGQEVQIYADVYVGRTFKGKVTSIGVQADRSHNFKVQIEVNNVSRDLMAGMYGSVSLSNSKSVSALSIPRKALIGSSKNPQVYVIKNGKSVLTSFNAGTSDGEFVEVISGISQLDQIVVKGQVNLQNQSKVKIKS